MITDFHGKYPPAYLLLVGYTLKDKFFTGKPIILLSLYSNDGLKLHSFSDKGVITKKIFLVFFLKLSPFRFCFVFKSNKTQIQPFHEKGYHKLL